MNILGAEYKVIHDLGELKEVNADGLCDQYTKTINVRLPQEMLDDQAIDAKNKRFNEVFRHELIHALLFESGMTKYENDEDIVDWIARMFPKMAELFKSEGVDDSDE